MCDIYFAKCNEKECNVEIDMHLENYATERDEIVVFCEKHIPSESVWIFEMTSRKDPYDDFKKGTKIGVRSLTQNAKKHARGNCPNTSQTMSVCSYDKLGRKRNLAE